MAFRHLLAVMALPFTVTVVVPFLLAGHERADLPVAARLGGAFLAFLGLSLLIATIRQFARRGRGTLAPWDPPVRLVVGGIYRHVRNPMISGVLLILVGESLVLASMPIAAWAAAFFTVNAIYIPLVEEKGLLGRFGADYARYCHHVPRWIPRWSAWDPGSVP